MKCAAKAFQMFLWAISFVFISTVTGYASDEGARGPVIRLVTGDNYPPFVDRDLEGGGWVAAEVVLALERAGFQVEPLQWWPWKRGLRETRAGNTDGTFPWGYTDERAVDVLYSKPLFHNTAHAWIRTGSTVSLENALRMKFCLPLGYVEFGRTKELIEKFPQSRISVPTMTQCFLMLRTRRTDIVISTQNDAEAAMEEAGLEPDDFERLEPHMHRITYHFIVGRDRQYAEEIIKAVNTWFRESAGDTMR